MTLYEDFAAVSELFEFKIQLHIKLTTQGKWSARLDYGHGREECGTQHATRAEAVEAALKKAKELNARSQSAFEGWVATTMAKLTSEQEA